MEGSQEQTFPRPTMIKIVGRLLFPAGAGGEGSARHRQPLEKGEGNAIEEGLGRSYSAAYLVDRDSGAIASAIVAECVVRPNPRVGSRCQPGLHQILEGKARPDGHHRAVSWRSQQTGPRGH